ncbi:uncharacterized protein LOC134726608 [Mytilus trossulus]|uniref:uncharacterized protein LOC134726608 n=1 Tax=Mytilus trossulus TaxID=6551 RepID=UPI0030070EFB
MFGNLQKMATYPDHEHDEEQEESIFEIFFQDLDETLSYCENIPDNPPNCDIEYFRNRLKSAVDGLNCLEFNLVINRADQSLIEQIQTLLSCLQPLREHWSTIDFSMPSSFLSIVDGAGCISATDRLGRPPAFICTDQVEYLFKIGFKIGEIARMFLVHRTTLSLTEMKSLLQYCNNIAAILRQTNLFARSVCKKVAGCCSYLQYSCNVTATKFVCKKIAASLLQCCKKEFVCQKVAGTFSFII